MLTIRDFKQSRAARADHVVTDIQKLQDITTVLQDMGANEQIKLFLEWVAGLLFERAANQVDAKLRQGWMAFFRYLNSRKPRSRK
jgi:hypothetical protein